MLNVCVAFPLDLGGVDLILLQTNVSNKLVFLLYAAMGLCFCNVRVGSINFVKFSLVALFNEYCVVKKMIPRELFVSVLCDFYRIRD